MLMLVQDTDSVVKQTLNGIAFSVPIANRSHLSFPCYSPRLFQIRSPLSRAGFLSVHRHFIQGTCIATRNVGTLFYLTTVASQFPSAGVAYKLRHAINNVFVRCDACA
jgi:hypothetical protein